MQSALAGLKSINGGNRTRVVVLTLKGKPFPEPIEQWVPAMDGIIRPGQWNGSLDELRDPVDMNSFFEGSPSIIALDTGMAIARRKLQMSGKLGILPMANVLVFNPGSYRFPKDPQDFVAKVRAEIAL